MEKEEKLELFGVQYSIKVKTIDSVKQRYGVTNGKGTTFDVSCSSLPSLLHELSHVVDSIFSSEELRIKLYKNLVEIFCPLFEEKEIDLSVMTDRHLFMDGKIGFFTGSEKPEFREVYSGVFVIPGNIVMLKTKNNTVPEIGTVLYRFLTIDLSNRKILEKEVLATSISNIWKDLLKKSKKNRKVD